MPPKPSLESLPTELKLRIAEMCAIQDARLSQTLGGIALELGLVNEIDATAQFWEDQWERGPHSSLGCLFQTINATKQLNKRFLLGIGPRYGHLAESLSAYGLGRASSHSAADFLMALPLLTGLKEVSLGSTRVLAHKLDTEGGSHTWDNYDSLPYVEAAVSRLLARVLTVRLSPDGLDDTLSLCFGSKITTLEVSLNRPDDFARLNQVLPSFTALSELCITFNHQLTASNQSVWAGHAFGDACSPPSLRHLRVDLCDTSSTIIALIAQLGRHATRLSLDLWDPFSMFSAGRFFPEGVSWPAVHTLHVEDRFPRAENSIGEDIVRHASPAVFPRLDRLLWPLQGTESGISVSTRLPALREFLGIRHKSVHPIHIRIQTDHPAERSESWTLVDETTGSTGRVSVERVITKSSPSFPLSVQGPFWDPEYRSPQLDNERLHDMLKTVMQESSDAAKRALAVGDRRQLERMVRAAGMLEYLRTEARC